MMVKQSPASISATFSALADPIRRGILARLSRGEASVGELAKPFRVSAPAISRHLRVLEKTGLLSRQKQGRVHRCRLNPRPMLDAARWIADCRHFGEQQFDSLERFLDESGDDSQEKENPAWHQPAPVSKQRSNSAAHSKRRAKKSSAPGPTRIK